MDSDLVRACFENLKKDVSDLYSKNSKADTDGQINMLPVLRQLAKLEYALDGDIAKIIMMDIEDRRAARIRGDKILEDLWGTDTLANKVREDFANNVKTCGPTPAMAKYAIEQRESKNHMLKLTIARGRVEGAQQLLDQLKAEQAALETL